MSLQYLPASDPRMKMSFLAPVPPERPESFVIMDKEETPALAPSQALVSESAPIQTVSVEPVMREERKESQEEKPSALRRGLDAVVSLVSPGGAFDAAYWDTNSGIGRIINRSRNAQLQNAEADIRQMNAYAQLMNASGSSKERSRGTYGKLVDDMMSKGYDFNTADAFAKDYLMKQGGTNISFGENSLEKMTGDLLSERAKSIYDSANQADNILPVISRLRQSLLSGVLTTGEGALGDVAQRFMADFGISNPETVKSRADFNRVMGEHLYNIISAQNKGQISNKELDHFKQQSLNFGNSTQQNLSILDEFERLMRRNLSMRDALDKAIRTSHSTKEALLYLNEHMGRLANSGSSLPEIVIHPKTGKRLKLDPDGNGYTEMD